MAEFTCPLCSQPIPPGTSVTRRREDTVHPRCRAAETRLGAIEIQETSQELRRTARDVVAQAESLGEPSVALTGQAPDRHVARSPDSGEGLTTGPVFAVDAPDRLRMGGVTFRVADPALLHGLAVGMHVTVAWTYLDGHRQAHQIQRGYGSGGWN